jgi:antitoxin CptB
MPVAPTMRHPDLLGPDNPHGMLRDGGRLDIDTRRRRLLFRCWHRGTQEIDLIFGPFAERCLPGLSIAQLDRFEALLDCSDVDLFDWVTGRSTPPPEHDHALSTISGSRIPRSCVSNAVRCRAYAGSVHSSGSASRSKSWGGAPT